MEPTLYNEDNLITQKIMYHFNDPERFDVIVFPFKHGERVYYIKRIIGLPGETVQKMLTNFLSQDTILQKYCAKN